MHKESRRFLGILLVIFFVLFLFVISGFFAPLLFGLLLAGISFPLYEKMARSFRSHTLAAAVTVLLVSLLVILPFMALLGLLAKEAVDIFVARDALIQNEFSQKAVQWATKTFGVSLEQFIEEEFAPSLKSFGVALSKEIGALLGNALSLGLQFFVMLVTLFYMLRDGKKFGEFLTSASPLAKQEEDLLYHTFKTTGRAIMSGTLAAALVQGILGGVGFFFAGLGAPILWGTVIGFLSLIPFLGAYVVFLPAGLYLLASGKITLAIVFLLYNILIVSTVDNFMKPALIGGKIKTHPLFVLIAILGGIQAFGLMGILYGPLIFALFLALLNVYGRIDAAGGLPPPPTPS